MSRAAYFASKLLCLLAVGGTSVGELSLFCLRLGQIIAILCVLLQKVASREKVNCLL